MERRVRIAPSLLSADFGRLAEEVARLEAAGADWLHVDVMDGHFVPNISIGLPVVRTLRRLTRLPLDCHLMIADPDRYLGGFVQAGADIVTVHVEACPHLHRTLDQIRRHGARAGAALNPHTLVSTLRHVLGELDLVLIMSVNPGFGGQAFIPAALDKVAEARRMLDETGSRAEIEVDGGVGPKEAPALRQAGATVLVSGSALWATEDWAATIAGMRGTAV